MPRDNTLKKRSEIHLIRRFWHTVAGVLILIPYFMGDVSLNYIGYFSTFFCALGFYFDFKRQTDQDLNQKIQNIFRPIMRKSEQENYSGIPFYALGVSLAIFLYPEKVALLAVLFLVFADPIASIVGVYLGKNRIFPNKTLEGTIAAFIVCFAIVLIYSRYVPMNADNLLFYALLGGVSGATSELLSAFNIDDNFTIPVVSGALMTLFATIFSIF